MGLRGIHKAAMRTVLLGSAHGRFQVLHKGHIEYLLAAKSRCDFLFVGITQYDLGSLASSPVDRHREAPLNNPLTYFERMQNITDALLDEGVRHSEFDVIPFPVDIPEKLPLFLPIEVPVYTTIYDDWNRHKVEVLRKLGYEVVVLWERTQKLYDGVRIRSQLRNGDPEWKSQVPQATVRCAERYRLMDRLISLSVDEDESNVK